jgi:hypothetical protein
MQHNHNLERLTKHILPLSKADTFDEAVKEWDFISAEFHDDGSSCPCGQPIKEVCYIHNTVTDEFTHVGNVCVGKFMGMDTGTLFSGLKRLRENPEANPNQAVINYAEEKGLLYGSEFKFLTDTKNKRKLSAPQMSWKKKINWRIINAVKVKKE